MRAGTCPLERQNPVARTSKASHRARATHPRRPRLLPLSLEAESRHASPAKKCKATARACEPQHATWDGYTLPAASRIAAAGAGACTRLRRLFVVTRLRDPSAYARRADISGPIYLFSYDATRRAKAAPLRPPRESLLRYTRTTFVIDEHFGAVIASLIEGLWRCTYMEDAALAATTMQAGNAWGATTRCRR